MVGNVSSQVLALENVCGSLSLVTGWPVSFCREAGYASVGVPGGVWVLACSGGGVTVSPLCANASEHERFDSLGLALVYLLEEVAADLDASGAKTRLTLVDSAASYDSRS